MQKPAFTVIISTYNRSDLLPRAIKSVLHQTFRDFELLVIDNGSTDNTHSVIEKMRDERLRYFLNPAPTKSCDAPRNLGIRLARGALISFLDDDDIWYPTRLEKVKEAFDNDPETAVVCHYENLSENGGISKELAYGPQENNIYETLLYRRNCLSSCATTITVGLLRKLNGFDLRKEFDAAADYDLWLRIAQSGEKIFFLKEALGEFTITGRNGSLVDPAFQYKIASLIKYHMLKYEKKPVVKLSNIGMLRLCILYSIAGRSFVKAKQYKRALMSFSHTLLFILLRPLLIFKLFSKINCK